jgi:hypothetical protein
MGNFWKQAVEDQGSGWLVVKYQGEKLVVNGVKPSLIGELLALIVGVRIVAGPFPTKEEAEAAK